MTFDYRDNAVARVFDALHADDLADQLNFYFMNLAERDAEAQVTVLAGPQVWSTPDGGVHALLVVKSESAEDPYGPLGLRSED